MTNVIFFELVKRLCTNKKILHVSQGIFMWNMKILSLTVKTLLARLKIRTEWQKDEMTDIPVLY